MSRPLHLRLFAPIALAAILLLALVPTAGRLATLHVPGAAAHAAEAAKALLAAPDMLHQHQAHANGADGSLPSHPPSGEHDGHDCGYCPLLTATVSPDARPGSPPALRAGVPEPVSARDSRPADARTPGLGSRGPPGFVQG